MSDTDKKLIEKDDIVVPSIAHIDASKITPSCISSATLGTNMVIRAGTIKATDIPFKK